MSNQSPHLLQRICPGCGVQRVGDGACVDCRCPAPSAYRREPRDYTPYFLVPFSIPLFAIALFCSDRNESVDWVFAVFSALIAVFCLSIGVMSFRSRTEDWRVQAGTLGVYPSGLARFSLQGGAILSSTGSRWFTAPVGEGLGPLAACQDADLSEALSQLLHPHEQLEQALPMMMALARAARGELAVEAVWIKRWADQAELVDVVVTGDPDWLLQHALAWTETQGPGQAAEVQRVKDWLKAHPEWMRALG